MSPLLAGFCHMRRQNLHLSNIRHATDISYPSGVIFGIARCYKRPGAKLKRAASMATLSIYLAFKEVRASFTINHRE